MFFRYFKEIHWPLVFSALGLVALGTLFIHSASLHDGAPYLLRQFFWVGVGISVMFLVPLVGYRTFLSASYLFYFFSILLLLGVLVAGEERLGAQRWIRIGQLSLQPSELAKIATIIAVSNYLGGIQKQESSKSTLLLAIGMVVLPFLFIVKQPDLGTSLIFIPMLAAILFIWGLKIRYFILSMVLGAVTAPLMWRFLKPYQQKRILTFIDPTQDPLGSGYTALQSKIAVGSGGFWGKGYLHGTQSQLQFVPEHHTDFIFCVIAEEWGFLGSLLVIFLYGLLFRNLFQVMQHTTDIKAKLLVVGIISILFSQAFINIAMSYGLMPITGITLPFVSYGGSSFVATAFAIGIVLSVYKERSIF